jgi:polyisoprenoid-binding protein YceI
MSRYVIDPGVSRFTVRGFASGVLSALGHNPVIGIRNFTGEAAFDEGAPEQSSLHITIPAGLLEVQNNASEKDRREMKRVMDEEVLEVSRYPEIVFQSTGVTGGGENMPLQIDANLTLHGVTRSIRVPARVFLMGDLLRANGSFSVLQSDYRIQPVSVAGGTLKLKDELKLEFDIAARQGESNVLSHSR